MKSYLELLCPMAKKKLVKQKLRKICQRSNFNPGLKLIRLTLDKQRATNLVSTPIYFVSERDDDKHNLSHLASQDKHREKSISKTCLNIFNLLIENNSKNILKMRKKYC